MAVDLDAFVEQSQSKRQRKRQMPHPEDSIVAIVEDETVSQIVGWIEAQQNQVELVQRLAGEEDPTKWSNAIANWMERYEVNQPVRLIDLLRDLPMPWVEIWLGLLLGRFELEQVGEFYTDEVLIRASCEVEECSFG